MQSDPANLHDFAARYTTAWCSQDPTKVAECYSVTGSLTVNGGTAAVGRNAIAEVARSFMTTFPDMRLIMDKLLLQGDRVEYHWTLICTNTGRGGTGNQVRVSGFELWQIGEDGYPRDIARDVISFDGEGRFGYRRNRSGHAQPDRRVCRNRSQSTSREGSIAAERAVGHGIRSRLRQTRTPTGGGIKRARSAYLCGCCNRDSGTSQNPLSLEAAIARPERRDGPRNSGERTSKPADYL